MILALSTAAAPRVQLGPLAWPTGFGENVTVTGGTGARRALPDLDPFRCPGEFVFVTMPRVPDRWEPVATVCEQEGITVVVDRGLADRYGVAYDFVAAMITLRVRSSLRAVGLTATVAASLADAGISCNVVAGHFHDHLFVPTDRAEEALGLLGRICWTP
jgi:hypothetical protein